MIYRNIFELPPQVRSVLDIAAQELWLNAYGASHAITANDSQATQYAWGKVIQQAFPGDIDIAQVPQLETSPATTALNEPHSFTIDLASIKLDDDDTSWIQAFPVGTWHHPKHGPIEMTAERAERFAANVNSNVRGQELDIDYDHKERSNEASGWVKAAQAKADGLWLKVQWTADAAQKIKNKAYRYFSPEYLDEWEEPRTKAKIKDVLLGGALTNRPFLKGILPVNLSEVLSNSKAHNDGGKMDWNEIRVMLGLPDGTDEAAVKAEFTKRLTPVASDTGNGNDDNNGNGTPAAPPAPPAAPAPEPPATPPATPELVGAGASLSEQVKKLSESDPVIRHLSEQVDKLQMANKLSEITVKLSSLDTDKTALAPAAATKLRELMVEAPTALSDKIFDLFKEVVANGIVQLGEEGHNDHSNANASATKRLSDLVDARVKANTNLSYGEAMEIVTAEQPALFEEYRRESYLRENA